MKLLHLLEEKVDHLLQFLASIENINKNELAMSKLPSFRDIPWLIGICNDLRKDFIKNKEITLSNLIKGCNMIDNDFTTQERQKFMKYLDCFMELTTLIN
jgi:hypothetical protein